MKFAIRWLLGILLISSCFAKPTLYIIGDSTVRNSTPNQMGWGDPLVSQFDPAKIDVINRAIGGRSSRTFLNEGRWDAVMAHLKPGDYLLMQFGHNDNGDPNDEKCRASLKGIGEETQDIVRRTDQQPETVHTYGWYLRKYITEAKSKGATPIVVSLIPRNIWKDGKIARNNGDYGLWAKQVAEATQAGFIDFNNLLADQYESLGQEATAALFDGTDHTHTCAKGAASNAVTMAKAIRENKATDLGSYLLPADLWIPRIFSDHMVLQRNQANPIWGTTQPGTEVQIVFAKQSLKATADASGNWRATLPALPAGGPFELTVKAGKAERKYQDILIGEVWLCSGQSNMDFSLAKTELRSFSGAADWQNEVKGAKNPQLRMITVGWNTREYPQPEIEGEWKTCTPENAQDFSAAAYYFGRQLQETLKVPVGLVTSAFGASTAEAWISKDKLTANPDFKSLQDALGKTALNFRDHPEIFKTYGEQLAKWNTDVQDAKSKGTKQPKGPKNPDPFMDQHSPSVLFNGMIHPILPYGIKGAIWYQGESNLPSRQIYAKLQQALVEDWRARWNEGDFPFYCVQLAGYHAPTAEPGDSQIATIREQQAAIQSLPNAGTVTAMDIGDEKDIHPRNKKDVGLRLAWLALEQTYQQPLGKLSPQLKDSQIDGAKISLTFSHAEKGLTAKGGELKHFAIAGDDRKFVWADAVIQGDKVIVSSPGIAQPKYVRYAWADNPAAANLYSKEGLPALPFRTDH
jgi:sialate O-acetylesterase